MIVVDTSAIIAILLGDAEASALEIKLLATSERVTSPIVVVEATMVISRTSPAPKRNLDDFIHRAGISVHPIDTAQTEWAQHAFLRFGKGRHPARLNLGDCFSYATAKALDAPLLYVGGDFTLTDIRAA